MAVPAEGVSGSNSLVSLCKHTIIRLPVVTRRYNVKARHGSLTDGSGAGVRMNPDKTILRIRDPREQEQATLRYWRRLPLGDRLTAVWDLSEAAYSFAAAFKGGPSDYDARRFERTLTRVERPRR